MYTIDKLDPTTLPSSARNAFDTLIGDTAYYKQKFSQAKIIEIGASDSGVPVGIVRALYFPVLHYAEIDALVVEEVHRKHGIGIQLLLNLQAELKKENCPLLIYHYLSGQPTTADLEDILKKLGWEGPRICSVHCKFDATIFNPPWLEKTPPFPEGFREFSWSDLTEVDRHKLAHQEKQGMFSAEVSPIGEEERQIEMINSLGLRYKGEIIGWMVTHRTTPEVIQYSCFFIQRKWQMTGIAVKLLSDSIKLQIRSSVKWGILEVNLEKTEPSWKRFLERRLIPYAQEVGYTKSAWLDLSK